MFCVHYTYNICLPLDIIKIKFITKLFLLILIPYKSNISKYKENWQELIPDSHDLEIFNINTQY